MKKKILILLVSMALLVGILSGCTEETTVANVAPVSAITCVETGYVGDVITFLSAATDADGTIASWSWSIDAGDEAGTEETFANTFDAEGTYTITLTVTDDDGDTHESDPCSIVITFTPPTVEITPPETVTNNTAAAFTAVPTAGAGTIETTAYAWEVDGEAQGDDVNTTELTYTFTTIGDHTVKVTVTDSNGYTGTHEITVTVAEAE